MLQDLATSLGVPSENIEVYDPMFESVDLEVIKRGGFQVLKKNEKGRYRLRHNSELGGSNDESKSAEGTKQENMKQVPEEEEIQTIVFMPHCPRGLYEGFLDENWDKRLWVSDHKTSVEESNELEGVNCILLANNLVDYVLR